MEYIVLGAGTGAPMRERGAPGFVVETRSTRILIDPGPGAVHRTVEAGVDFAEIDAVVLTHLHTDHTSDLGPLVHALLYTPGLTWEGNLPLFGPPGTTRFVSALFDLYPVLERGRQRVEVQEVAEPFDIGSIRLRPYTMRHSRNLVCLGYRFEDAGVVLAHAGDTAPCKGVEELASEADLLSCEAAWPSDSPEEVHLTPHQAGEIASRAKARSLLLMHLYPVLSDEQALEEVQERYGGPVRIATDLTRYAVPLGG